MHNISHTAMSLGAPVPTDKPQLLRPSNLGRSGQYSNYYGNEIVVSDFSSQAGNVLNSYRAGDIWKRGLLMD